MQKTRWGVAIAAVVATGCGSQSASHLSSATTNALTGSLGDSRVATSIDSVAGSSVSRIPGLAFGVNPFLNPRPQLVNGVSQYFRSDFSSMISNSAAWELISTYSGEYEMYFEMLEAAQAYPAQVSLASLVKTLSTQGMSVTFQVGGARPMNGQCAGSAAAAAAFDISYLESWIKAGGTISKLISDNSFIKYYTATPACYSNPTQFINLVASEQAAYFQVMSRTFPNLKFAVTDGLGEFSVADPTGTQGGGTITYATTSPSTITAAFGLGSYLSALQTQMKNVGLTLDEFTMDCAEAFVFDAAAYPNSRYLLQGRNYGRLIAGQKLLASLELGSGIYWEVFPPAGGAASQAQLYHDIGEEQVQAFRDFGGIVTHNRFTLWTDTPSVTGPETTPYTALNDIRDAMIAQTSGDFRIGSAFYRSMISTYCLYDSWSVFLADGGNSAIDPTWTGVPTSMKYVGTCPIAAGIFAIGPAIYYSNGINYCLFDSWNSFMSLTGLSTTSSLRTVDHIPASMVSQGLCQ